VLSTNYTIRKKLLNLGNRKMKPDIMKCYEDIGNMAKNVYDLENAFDYSMKGVFLDMFVTNYIQETGVVFWSMFDYVLEKQVKDYDTYGDIDGSVKKISFSGELGRDDDYTYTTAGLYVRDIFSGNNFLFAKRVKKHKIIPKFETTELHVRKVFREMNRTKVPFRKYFPYCDMRDEGYTVSFIQPTHNRPIEVLDKRGMLYRVEKYEQAYRAIRLPYNELKETVNQIQH
jgi:hypothetical protein